MSTSQRLCCHKLYQQSNSKIMKMDHRSSPRFLLLYNNVYGQRYSSSSSSSSLSPSSSYRHLLVKFQKDNKNPTNFRSPWNTKFIISLLLFVIILCQSSSASLFKSKIDKRLGFGGRKAHVDIVMEKVPDKPVVGYDGGYGFSKKKKFPITWLRNQYPFNSYMKKNSKSQYTMKDPMIGQYSSPAHEVFDPIPSTWTKLPNYNQASMQPVQVRPSPLFPHIPVVMPVQSYNSYASQSHAPSSPPLATISINRPTNAETMQFSSSEEQQPIYGNAPPPQHRAMPMRPPMGPPMGGPSPASGGGGGAAAADGYGNGGKKSGFSIEAANPDGSYGGSNGFGGISLSFGNGRSISFGGGQGLTIGGKAGAISFGRGGDQAASSSSGESKYSGGGISFGNGGLTIGGGSDDSKPAEPLSASGSGYRGSTASGNYGGNGYDGYKKKYYSDKPTMSMEMPRKGKKVITADLDMAPIKVRLHSSPRVKITTGSRDPLEKPSDEELEEDEEDIFQPPEPFPKVNTTAAANETSVDGNGGGQNGTMLNATDLANGNQNGSQFSVHGSQYQTYQLNGNQYDGYQQQHYDQQQQQHFHQQQQFENQHQIGHYQQQTNVKQSNIWQQGIHDGNSAGRHYQQIQPSPPGPISQLQIGQNPMISQQMTPVIENTKTNGQNNELSPTPSPDMQITNQPEHRPALNHWQQFSKEAKQQILRPLDSHIDSAQDANHDRFYNGAITNPPQISGDSVTNQNANNNNGRFLPNHIRQDTNSNRNLHHSIGNFNPNGFDSTAPQLATKNEQVPNNFAKPLVQQQQHQQQQIYDPTRVNPGSSLSNNNAHHQKISIHQSVSNSIDAQNDQEKPVVFDADSSSSDNVGSYVKPNKQPQVVNGRALSPATAYQITGLDSSGQASSYSNQIHQSAQHVQHGYNHAAKQVENQRSSYGQSTHANQQVYATHQNGQHHRTQAYSSNVQGNHGQQQQQQHYGRAAPASQGQYSPQTSSQSNGYGSSGYSSGGNGAYNHQDYATKIEQYEPYAHDKRERSKVVLFLKPRISIHMANSSTTTKRPKNEQKFFHLVNTPIFLNNTGNHTEEEFIDPDLRDPFVKSYSNSYGYGYGHGYGYGSDYGRNNTKSTTKKPKVKTTRAPTTTTIAPEETSTTENGATTTTTTSSPDTTTTTESVTTTTASSESSSSSTDSSSSTTDSSSSTSSTTEKSSSSTERDEETTPMSVTTTTEASSSTTTEEPTTTTARSVPNKSSPSSTTTTTTTTTITTTEAPFTTEQESTSMASALPEMEEMMMTTTQAPTTSEQSIVIQSSTASFDMSPENEGSEVVNLKEPLGDQISPKMPARLVMVSRDSNLNPMLPRGAAKIMMSRPEVKSRPSPRTTTSTTTTTMATTTSEIPELAPTTLAMDDANDRVESTTVNDGFTMVSDATTSAFNDMSNEKKQQADGEVEIATTLSSLVGADITNDNTETSRDEFVTEVSEKATQPMTTSSSISTMMVPTTTLSAADLSESPVTEIGESEGNNKPSQVQGRKSSSTAPTIKPMLLNNELIDKLMENKTLVGLMSTQLMKVINKNDIDESERTRLVRLVFNQMKDKQVDFSSNNVRLAVKTISWSYKNAAKTVTTGRPSPAESIRAGKRKTTNSQDNSSFGQRMGTANSKDKSSTRAIDTALKLSKPDSNAENPIVVVLLPQGEKE